MIYEKKHKKLLMCFLIVVSILFIVCSLSAVSAVNKTISPEDEGGIHGAINDSSVNPGDTIFLQPGTYNKTGNDTNFRINKSITLQGNGSSGSVIIDARRLSRIFEIGNNNITFINIVFINGNYSSGGAIYNNNYANISFINCKFINNIATSNGGAIYNRGNNFSLINCTFSNNEAYEGGAIYDNGASSFSLINSTFSNNIARHYGGAIFNYYGSNFTVINTNFTNNTATWGGAIFGWLKHNVTIMNSIFTNNKATDIPEGSGGAIYNEGDNYLIINSTFKNNVAIWGYGGAIINHGANFTIINSTFTNNTAYRSGGAIYNHDKSSYSSGTYNFKVINSTFTNNTAQWGGAIYNFGNSSTITNSEFIGNIASRYGGAIDNYGNLTLTDSSFTNNRAGRGGAIYNTANANMTLLRNTMSGNSADLGQMIYNDGNMGGLKLTYLNNGTMKVIKGRTVILLATLTDDMGNTVTGQSISFIVNGTTIGSVDSVEGYANISYIVPDFEGLLTVSGAYAGHVGYPITLLNGQLRTAIETNSTINTPNDVKVGQKVNITGVATDKNGDPIANTVITVTINGKAYAVTTDDYGNWVLPYTLTQAGNIDVSVQWDGNDTLFGFINSTSFDVEKSATNSTIVVPDDIKVGQKINISGVAKDEFGNILANTILKVVVNGNAYTVTTDINGKWILSYTPTKVGNMDVFVSWEGNDSYFGFINNTSFDVAENDFNIPVDNKTNTGKNENETNTGKNKNETNTGDNEVDDTNENSNNPVAAKILPMKNTGMPIIAIILLLVITLAIGIGKRK